MDQNPKIEREAGDWVLRRDRGLSAREQDELSQWIAADPRHAEALAMQRWTWEEFDRMAGLQSTMRAAADPDLFAPKPRFRRWTVITGTVGALAAAFTVFLLLRNDHAPASVSESRPMVARIEERALDDGTVVSLNRGAEIAVEFTAAERRIRLLRGEANFRVANQPARPFTVASRGVSVRAIGTSFNVRLDTAAIEVLVTEGRVRVEAGADAAGPGRPAGSAVTVDAGQSALVRLVSSAPVPQVGTLSREEMDTRLAWQPRVLDFTEAPLADIVAEFNRRTPIRLTLADRSLGETRLTATFRSDNVEGFVRLMESSFNMRAEWRGSDLVLSRAP